MRLEELESLGVHENGEHAIGDLGRIADARGRDGRGVDFHPRIAVHDALERLAEPARPVTVIRNLVVLAGIDEGFGTLQDFADDLDIFPGALQRLAIGDAVPALHHLGT